MVADQLDPLLGLLVHVPVDQVQHPRAVRSPIDEVPDLDHHQIRRQAKRLADSAQLGERRPQLVEADHRNVAHNRIPVPSGSLITVSDQEFAGGHGPGVVPA